MLNFKKYCSILSKARSSERPYGAHLHFQDEAYEARLGCLSCCSSTSDASKVQCFFYNTSLNLSVSLACNWKPLEKTKEDHWIFYLSKRGGQDERRATPVGIHQTEGIQRGWGRDLLGLSAEEAKKPCQHQGQPPPHTCG